MDAVDSLYNLIEKGRSGLNVGLNIGLPKLQSMTYGVQRQTYTLICGATGSGKTTLALYSYIYRVLNDNLGDMRYRILMFSMEMTQEILLAKLMSTYIWETYAIEINYNHIMSRQTTISEDHYELVESCKPWLKAIMKQLTIIDRPVSSGEAYAALKNYASRNGTETVGANGKITYKPNIEGELVQIIVDHLGLAKISGNKSKKEEMDLFANYLLSIRNIYAYSPLVLMQLNRTSSSMDRRNANMSEIELSDIKDTGTAAEAAELVLAIFSPWRVKQGKHQDYNIRILQDHYRAIQILKSRLGESEKQVSVNFFGSVGTFKELPPAEELNRLSEDQIRSRYTKLSGTPQNEIIIPPVQENKLVFKF